MRVLHVDTATEWRGGQQQLAHLLAHTPGLWAGVPDSPLARRARPPDVPLCPGNDPRNLWRLRQAARGLDLVAVHTPHAHMAALAVACPVVVHRRTDVPPSSVWRYRRAARIIAVSARIREILIGCGVAPDRVAVVHSGVRSRAGGRPAADLRDLPRPLIGCVGALARHKGHDVLIRALPGLPGSLVIAGIGPEEAALRDLARSLGVADRLRLLGQREDVADVLAALDVFAHPSRTEGLGQVIAEALSAGCRAVASDAGGIPEVIGGAGLLVLPERPDALAAAIRRSLEIPAAEAAARAVAQAERFSVGAMVAGTLENYRAVLSGAGVGPGATG